MLMYVDLGSLLGGRFGSQTELVFNEFSSSVFMLMYVDFRRMWEHFGPHFRDFWHPKSTSDRFMKNHRNHWRVSSKSRV